MTSLEEKKKIWDANKAKRIAERIAKADAWRTKEAKRKEKEAMQREEVSKALFVSDEKPESALVDYLKEVKEKRKAEEIERKLEPKKKEIKKTPVKKKVFKPILEKIFTKKKVKKQVPKKKLMKVKALEKKVEETKPMLKVEEIIKAITTELKPKVKKKVVAPVKMVEKKPVEIMTITGPCTDISMPKIKEESEMDWSARRFYELEERLKKLRRF